MPVMVHLWDMGESSVETHFSFGSVVTEGRFSQLPTSSNFPVTPDALQRAYRGGKKAQEGDGFFVVISPDGSRLVYATFLGGGDDDLIRSIALGPNGEVCLVGSTFSRDFPVTLNTVQAELDGSADAFIVKSVPTK
jgi:hypothetical protein